MISKMNRTHVIRCRRIKQWKGIEEGKNQSDISVHKEKTLRQSDLPFPHVLNLRRKSDDVVI